MPSHLVTRELVKHACTLGSTEHVLSVEIAEGPGNLILTLEVLYQTVRNTEVSALVACLLGSRFWVLSLIQEGL